ncbi:uncharacterized protein LOC131620235 [Vicia villosa]|uniref:uncharacterized protein LOC131620235 n=1 Tax=Vicia villosa TaxID=3911 RepID=UPI00273BD221|nr:uncharacterized protein LOC131620235 [Vicia villosa]
MLAGSLGQMPQANAGNWNADDDEYRALGKFQRKNPPIFEGEHEPDKAQAWLKEIEKIFRVMNCTDAQKRSKCLKFVNGLRPDIKKAIGYQQITRFAKLINKSRIYDEDSRESTSHYKAMNDKKGQFRGKPYDNKKKAGFGGKPSGGVSSAPIKCFKCGVEGHRAVNCSKVEVTCFKCGKSGHKANECRGGSKRFWD